MPLKNNVKSLTTDENDVVEGGVVTHGTSWLDACL